MASGLEQPANWPPSIEHSNVAAASSDARPKAGLVSAISDPSAGPDVIEVSGAVASTPNVRVAGDGSTLCAGSTARTANVCWPSESGPIASALEHDAKPPPSIAHSNVDPGSVAEKANVGVGPLPADPSA